MTDKNVIGDTAVWLKDGTICIITLWNNVPLVVTPPMQVELQGGRDGPGVAR